MVAFSIFALLTFSPNADLGHKHTRKADSSIRIDAASVSEGAADCFGKGGYRDGYSINPSALVLQKSNVNIPDVQTPFEANGCTSSVSPYIRAVWPLDEELPDSFVFPDQEVLCGRFDEHEAMIPSARTVENDHQYAPSRLGEPEELGTRTENNITTVTNHNDQGVSETTTIAFRRSKNRIADLATDKPRVASAKAARQRVSKKRLNIINAMRGDTIPKAMIQPHQIYEQLMIACSIEDETAGVVVTRLFYSIGSPNAIRDLRDAVKAVRSKPLMLEQISSPIHTVSILEHLDANHSACKILRRLYLTWLYALRNDRIDSFEAERSRRPRRTPSKRLTSSATLAHDDLVCSAYPSIHSQHSDFAKRRSWVENKLRRARNWSKLVEELSSGVLALIPNTGPLVVSDTE